MEDVAREARAELREKAKEQRRVQRIAQDQERLTWPRLSLKKGDFAYKPIYGELKKYIPNSELPQLKNAQRAGKKTKQRLLSLFQIIADKKRGGYVYYSIRGIRNRERFNAIFDPDTMPIFKGGWIKGTLANNGDAAIRFDNHNPIIQHTKASFDSYIYLDGPAFLEWAMQMESTDLDDEEVEELAFETFLAELKPGLVYFPFSHLGFSVKRGGSTDSTPSIARILLNLVHDSSGLMDKITALVNYA